MGEISKIEWQKRLHNCKKAIEEIEKKEERIKFIGEAIKEFSGLNIKNSGRFVTPIVKKYQSIFYKICLEQKLTCRLSADYCGVDKYTPLTRRKSFTRSFETNPENRELYSRFCQYLIEKQKENEEKREISKIGS